MDLKIEMEKDGVWYDVEFSAENITIANDGIGAYEFWGRPGIDNGMNYVEDFSVKNLKVTEQDSGKPSNAITEDDIYNDSIAFEVLNEHYFREVEEWD